MEEDDTYDISVLAHTLSAHSLITRLWLASTVISQEDGRQPIPSKHQRVPMSEEVVHGPEAFKLPVVMSLAAQATVRCTGKREAAT